MLTQESVGLRVNLLRKSHFGQISRSNSLNRTTIRLIRSKILTQNDIPSLRFPKSDRLLGIAGFNGMRAVAKTILRFPIGTHCERPKMRMTILL
jgi:hypothetical protein